MAEGNTMNGLLGNLSKMFGGGNQPTNINPNASGFRQNMFGQQPANRNLMGLVNGQGFGQGIGQGMPFANQMNRQDWRQPAHGMASRPIPGQQPPFAGSAMGNLLSGQTVGLSPDILAMLQPLLDRFRGMTGGGGTPNIPAGPTGFGFRGQQ